MSPKSCYLPHMSTPDSNPPPVPFAERLDRNITAELARHMGLSPANALPAITNLSDDTVARRRKVGDWRVPELILIARAVGVSLSDLVAEVGT